MREKRLTNALAVRLSPEQLEAIDAMVVEINSTKPLGALDVGRTEVIRRAVAEYIDRNRGLAPAVTRAAAIQTSVARFEERELDVIPSLEARGAATARPRGGRVPPEAKASPNASQTPEPDPLLTRVFERVAAHPDAAIDPSLAAVDAALGVLAPVKDGDS